MSLLFSLSALQCVMQGSEVRESHHCRNKRAELGLFARAIYECRSVVSVGARGAGVLSLSRVAQQRDDGRVKSSAAEQSQSRAADAGVDLWPAEQQRLSAPPAVGGNEGAGLALKAPLADPGARVQQQQ